MLKDLNIPQADWITIISSELSDIGNVVKRIEEKFEYPVFIKPANAGSSVGIGKSHNKEELIEHLENAAKVDSKILVEEFIDGREVECAVLGNDDPVASVLGEIIPDKEFYDYEAKYHSDSKLIIPAPISETKSNQIREIAKKAFTKIGLKGMSRIDFANDLAECKKVKITDGPFKGMIGKVKSYDLENKKVELLLDLFGQETSVEVSLSEIENLK